MEILRQMGVTAYPLVILALATLVQGLYALRGLLRGDRNSGSFRIHAVLALGGLSALVGLLGTLVGVTVMARIAEGVREVPPSLL